MINRDLKPRPFIQADPFGAAKVQPQRQSSRLPRAAVGLVALALAGGATLAGLVPLFVSGTYVAMSAASYLLYYLDKFAAGRGSRRTPESNLHLVDLLGGWPGALVAQQQFRHKTIKQPFQSVFWATVVLNLAAVSWLVFSGAATELAQSLGG